MLYNWTFGTDQTKSLQTEQKVGCLKKVAMNSWFLMKWILACLIAPRRRVRVGASSSVTTDWWHSESEREKTKQDGSRIKLMEWIFLTVNSWDLYVLKTIHYNLNIFNNLMFFLIQLLQCLYFVPFHYVLSSCFWTSIRHKRPLRNFPLGSGESTTRLIIM